MNDATRDANGNRWFGAAGLAVGAISLTVMVAQCEIQRRSSPALAQLDAVGAGIRLRLSPEILSLVSQNQSAVSTKLTADGAMWAWEFRVRNTGDTIVKGTHIGLPCKAVSLVEGAESPVAAGEANSVALGDLPPGARRTVSVWGVDCERERVRDEAVLYHDGGRGSIHYIESYLPIETPLQRWGPLLTLLVGMVGITIVQIAMDRSRRRRDQRAYEEARASLVEARMIVQRLTK